MTPIAAVQFQAVTKDYTLDWRGRRLRALDRVTWRLDPGQICGLLGPNGCGKSTSLRLLAGLARATSGQCLVLGGDPRDPQTRRRLGFMPEAPRAFDYLTGREVLRYHARLAGVVRSELDERVEALLRLVALEPAADRRSGTYSTGMARRLGLAQALVHDPELLVLDEPTAGLDPQAVNDFGVCLRALRRRGQTILFTSHVLTQVAEWCDRVVLLERGRVVAAGSVEALLGGAERQALIVDALSVEDQQAMCGWLQARGRTLHAVEPARQSLERVFAAYREPHGEDNA